MSCLGEWWLPSNPDKRARGKLSFNQASGAILDLEEGFAEHSKIICGVSLPVGRKITLQDCIPLSLVGLPGIPYKVFAHRVFLGAHFSQDSDIKFNSLHCQMSNLYEWLSKSGVKVEGAAGKKVVIEYNRPESISVSVNPELSVSIDFRNSFSSNVNGQIGLEEHAFASFYPKEARNLDEYFRWMQHFRNFLCLATQIVVFPKEIYGVVSDELPYVEVLYQLDAPINTKANTFNSLFAFKDVETKFESVLRNWYTKLDMFEPVCQLYFGSHYGRFVYLNLRFLCMVQALEAYHRVAVSNEELANQKHEERIASILNTTPLVHREWLRDKLVYSNEPNLRKRLKILCNMFPTTVKALIPARKLFINKVVDTRNYMTHYDLALKNKAANQKELFLITEELRVIVEMCLLHEVGFNTDEINSLILKHYQERLKRYSLQ